MGFGGIDSSLFKYLSAVKTTIRYMAVTYAVVSLCGIKGPALLVCPVV